MDSRDGQCAIAVQLFGTTFPFFVKHFFLRKTKFECNFRFSDNLL